MTYLICGTWFTHVWHDSLIRVTWLCNFRSTDLKLHIHTCDMTYPHVWHDSLIFVNWIILMCDMTNSCGTWLILMCDMTHSYVCHDSTISNPPTSNDACTRMTRKVRMCDMTHSYVWHDSFIRATWLIHTCDMTHSYVRHDSFILVT